MTWRALADRQAGFAAQLSAAIQGADDAGRFSPEQAAQIVDDVARALSNSSWPISRSVRPLLRAVAYCVQSPTRFPLICMVMAP
jgi:hypothetical protein